jgi:hypothetical protein
LPARIQEWPQVEPVVIGAVLFGMVAWCQGCHLVSIDPVELSS